MADLFPIVRPLLFGLDPETAHKATLLGARLGLAGKDNSPVDPALAVQAMGLQFEAPMDWLPGLTKTLKSRWPCCALDLDLWNAELLRRCRNRAISSPGSFA